MSESGPQEQLKRAKPSKLGAEKLTPEEQRRRFEKLSRELGTDSGEALDATFGKIVPPKLPTSRE